MDKKFAVIALFLVAKLCKLEYTNSNKKYFSNKINLINKNRGYKCELFRFVFAKK